MKLSERQQRVWDRAFRAVEPNIYDFVYFVDMLSEHDDGSLSEILDEFWNDSRKLMGMWLKFMWENETEKKI